MKTFHQNMIKHILLFRALERGISYPQLKLGLVPSYVWYQSGGTVGLYAVAGFKSRSAICKHLNHSAIYLVQYAQLL